MGGHGLYGRPPRELAPTPADAVQVSPLIPGSQALEDLSDGGLDAATLLAPPGVAERRYVLAQALRALKPGGDLLALAPKDKGGSRLGKELAAFGLEVAESGRRHHRICHAVRPAELRGLDDAIAAGAPRLSKTLGLWTQPGVFAWDRVDPGSALLLDHLPPLEGRGADLGCGLGVLARAVLASKDVAELALVDIDRRAVDCARRNVDDPRARFLWADVRGGTDLADLDFVVMNPPFHDGGAEDRSLGAAFIAAAARALKPGGRLLMVANRHLPYEAPLREAFGKVALLAETGGYKVHEARR
ncbi:MAG: class I SAM-dependent methyltransferase [Phenylobacterium sp.]|uniref:class I SAM-dependent methyltransferase n=1 Tax=Phenylobacterium sp. TaxID=1871053 RepID=UPI0017F9A94D|nr:class I SAM-dependent methyltransferase [Phenylobacterium sp.]MBA4792189.1 class I SAM-dependent methyltransferase [Phenylobacterium sp.]